MSFSAVIARFFASVFLIAIIDKVYASIARSLGQETTYTTVFTALHGVQTRSSDENSVRPSVCLSVTRVYV